MASYIGALDQGTTSTRFMVFDRSGSIVSSAQKEHEQIYPKQGWVEHDPEEIWRRTQDVIAAAMEAKRCPSKRSGCHRYHQSAGDDDHLGPFHRQGGLQCFGVARHPRCRCRWRIFSPRRAGPLSPEDGPSACDIFQRSENTLDSGQRFWGASTGGSRRGALWEYGYVSGLEANGRGRRGYPRNRHDERKPDAIVQSPHANVGR